MKFHLLALALLIAPGMLRAGDPCPIAVEINDLGAPSWLDRDTILNDLTSQSPWIGISHNYREDGITLTYIARQSPAEAAGLQVGDLITAIDGVPTSDKATVDALFDAKQIGDRMTFTRSGLPPATVTIGRTDPVAIGLVRALADVDCRRSNLSYPTDDEKRRVMPLLFDANRGFRCDDAHIALQAIAERDYQTRVYFVRGSRRILRPCPIGARPVSTARALTVKPFLPAHCFRRWNRSFRHMCRTGLKTRDAKDRAADPSGGETRRFAGPFRDFR